MIKITDGVNTKTVTLGMYENLYRKMGYTVVEDKPAVKEVKEVIVEEVVEKPVKPKNDVKKVKK